MNGLSKILIAVLVLEDELLARYIFHHPSSRGMIHHLLRLLYDSLRLHPRFPTVSLKEKWRSNVRMVEAFSSHSLRPPPLLCTQWRFDFKDFNDFEYFTISCSTFSTIARLLETFLLLLPHSENLPNIPLDALQVELVIPHLKTVVKGLEALTEEFPFMAPALRTGGPRIAELVDLLAVNQAGTLDLRIIHLRDDPNAIPQWKRCSATIKSPFSQEGASQMICTPVGEPKLTCGRVSFPFAPAAAPPLRSIAQADSRSAFRSASLLDTARRVSAFASLLLSRSRLLGQHHDLH